MSDASELYDAILKGNAKKAEEVTKAALAANFDASELVQKYMIPAMDEVGKRFECNDYFVPELLIAARAMKTSLALITPYLAKSGVEPAGRVVIGTVQGDLHDIGKNLVASMLEGGGFQVVDLGVNVRPRNSSRPPRRRTAPSSPSRPADHDHDHDEDRDRRLNQAGIRNKTRVMIGGPRSPSNMPMRSAPTVSPTTPGRQWPWRGRCRRIDVAPPKNPFRARPCLACCSRHDPRLSRPAPRQPLLLRRGSRHDPRSADRRPPQDAVGSARGLLEDPPIAWISITDNPGGGPCCPHWLAGKFAGRGANVVVHLTCKDLNRSGLEASAWRYASEGFSNILALTGDYPTAGFRGRPGPSSTWTPWGSLPCCRP